MHSVLRVTAAASAEARALTTATRLAQDLILDEDGDDETFIAGVILAASAAIATDLNYRRGGDLPATIARETVTETWRGADGARSLFLSRLPVADLIAVTENGVRIARLDEDDEANPDFLYEADEAAGLLYKLDASGCRARFSGPAIVVEYIGGFVTPGAKEADDALTVTMPADIESLCIRACRALIDQLRAEPGGAVKEESIPGFWSGKIAETSFAGGGLPPEIRDGLEPYRIRNL